MTLHQTIRGDGNIRRRVLLYTVFLASLYMITYSGRIEVSDEYQYFNGVRSQVLFGDLKLDLFMSQLMPVTFSDDLPFRSLNAEKGIIIAAAPLYWLADNIPGIGLIHTVFLFNIVACALVCAVVFYYALTLGYSEITALLAALSLGLGTILFPYSQTFFREPLMMIFLTLSALTLEHGRRHLRQSFIVLGFLLLIPAYFTKEAALLALPGLLILIIPDSWWKPVSQILLAVMGVILLFALLIVFTNVSQLIPDGLIQIGSYRLEPTFTRTSIHTALFSIGGSIWGTSPILLLAIPGGYMMWKRGESRTVSAVILIIVTYVMVYSLFRGVEWFGGLNWPQRFYLPVLPFFVLLMLPVLERAVKIRSPLLSSATALLVLYSLWWQVSGLAFPWRTYNSLTYNLSDGGLAYWGPGLNEFRYIRPVVLTELWGKQGFNAAWVRMELWWIPALLTALAVFCLWLMTRPRAGLVWVTPLLFVMIIGLTLKGIYNDPLYLGDDPALHAMLPVIQAELREGEILMVDDPKNSDFFLNYAKLGKRRIAVFPYHPGERGSFEQPLLRESENPDDLLAAQTAPVVKRLANRQSRLFLFTSGGPEIPWSMRPFERYMGKHYYRVGEQRTDADVRLLEYVTVDARNPAQPENMTDFTFSAASGERLELVGYRLPSGETYTAGAALPVSLYWRVPQTPLRNYIVALKVANADGIVIAEGEDSWPGATFKPTTTMQPDVPVWDHRALYLPHDAGEYQIWVIVYDKDDMTGAITNLNVTGSEVRDGMIAVLPTRITIAP